jgi:Transposase IS116/IS110/IS902 family
LSINEANWYRLLRQTFQELAHGIVFQDYLETVWTAQQRRDALIERISAMVGSWSLGPLVEALRGLRGIDMISAATFVASTGDLSRFESTRLLMGYLGLVPSEHSSGRTIRRGGITKTGNREAWRMLIEAAWSYQYLARVAKEKAEILVRLPKNVRDIPGKHRPGCVPGIVLWLPEARSHSCRCCYCEGTRRVHLGDRPRDEVCSQFMHYGSSHNLIALEHIATDSNQLR